MREVAVGYTLLATAPRLLTKGDSPSEKFWRPCLKAKGVGIGGPGGQLGGR